MNFGNTHFDVLERACCFRGVLLEISQISGKLVACVNNCISTSEAFIAFQGASTFL